MTEQQQAHPQPGPPRTRPSHADQAQYSQPPYQGRTPPRSTAD